MKQTLRNVSWAHETSAPSTSVYHRMARTRLLSMFFCILFAILPNIQVKGMLISTDFVDVNTSGEATAYFYYENNFYKIDWKNIKSTEVESIQFYVGDNSKYLNVNMKIQNDNSNEFLYLNGGSQSQIANLTSLSQGSTLNLYLTNLSNYAVNKNDPICSITHTGTNTPEWTWAADKSSASATFTCTGDNSVTATVNATISETTAPATATTAGTLVYTASATFNGTTYTDVKTINQYKVTLDDQSATTAGQGSVTATYDAAMPTPLALPAKTGYTFGGYYSGTNGTGTLYYNANGTSAIAICKLTSNITLYAKWTIIPYTITYLLDGGTNASGNTTTYNVESNTITLSAPTKTGYTFTGWTGTDLSAATISVTIPKGSTGNRTYTANWTINTYTVTFNANAGSDVASQTVNYEGKATTPAAPTRTGYTFSGWYASSDFSGTAYDFNTAVTSDITLYAKWTVKQYLLTWKNSDGTILEQEYLDYNTTIHYNGSTPTKAADDDFVYIFNGWFPVLEDGATITDNIIYVAKYRSELNLPTETIDEDTFYEISKQKDWDAFSKAVYTQSTTVNGILTADINLGTDQTMIGSNSTPYEGIFNGNGKTLTVNYNGSTDMMAPFSVVNGATISNLKVAGTVTSTGNYASGLVGAAGSSILTISNCEVAASISSPYCGGFIGHGQTSTPTIDNCIFSGSLQTTNYGGCFVSWKESTCKITIQNCLSVPYAISEGAFDDFVCTQNEGTVSVTNSYSYTNSIFSQTQGTKTDKTTMGSGKIARLLNCFDGTGEFATGLWGQTTGTDTHPVFMTANDANAVYCANIDNVKSYGNANSTITLPVGNLTFNDTKIASSNSYTDGIHTYIGTYTFPHEDNTLRSAGSAEDDMSKHTEKGTDGKTYYQISTPVQMKWFEYYVDKSPDYVGTCAKLMNDIDLSSICSATAGNWTPIAQNDNWKYWYAGTFDGNGKTISNLYINNATTQYQGLFGNTYDGCIIKDLNVTGNVTATGANGSNVALLIGSNNIGKIIRCTASGTVSGNMYTGGIAGNNNYGNIIQCVNHATVNDELDPTGGIAAYCNNGSIIDCANFGTVKTKENNYTSTGGIVGQCYSTNTISNNLNMGQVYVADVTEAYPILGTDMTASTAPSTVTDNYYLSASATAATYGTPKTAAEIAATATMASLLQGKQTDEEYWIADPTQPAHPMLKCFAKAAQVTKSDDLDATYYNTLAWTIPSGMKVYTVNSLASGKAHATEYTGTVVPAGTAVVISGAAGDYQLDFDRTSAVSAVSDNLLRGSDFSVTTAGDDATKTYSFYKLSLDASETAGSFGFYYGADGGVAFTSIAHKAYLPVSSQGGAAKGYRLSYGDDTTGISSASDGTAENGAWYTIGGIRLNGKPTTGGLYINNGKKVIIK